MRLGKVSICVTAVFAIAGIPCVALADEGGGGAAEMMKKLQNPLANIKAIMTDNVIGFDTGNDEGTSYSFQLQGVHAIDFPDKGFT
ncbi:MAG: hypothetical protein V3V82_01945, partial [Acidimicrobiia bacterium]